MTDAGTSATDTGRRFVRNVRWQFVANASQALLGGLYLVVLGRLLGATDFGLFSTIMAIVSVAGLLLEMRLQEVVARDFCQVDSNATTPQQAMHLVDLFLLETASRLLPVLAIAATAYALTQAFKLPANTHGMLVLAAAAFLVSKAGNSVSTGLLRVLSRTDLIARCMSFDWGLRLALTTLLGAVFGLDLWLALVVAFLVGAGCNLLQVSLAIRAYNELGTPLTLRGWRIGEGIARLRAARRLIAANLGVSATDLMAKDLDVAMISSVLSADKVGLYKMSKSFVQVLWRAIDPFYLAVMPEVQKLWQQREVPALKRLLRKTSLRLLALAAVLAAIGITLVWLFGTWVLGPGYEEVPRLMLTMSPWLLICGPLVWGAPLAIAVNRPELATMGSALGMVLGLAAFSLLLPPLGLVGAAVAWNLTLISGFVFTAVVASFQARTRLSQQTA